ncbi:type IV secretion system DNA-binding domain-containing protein [Patescibacteria group bacterium]|nr:type IV secretion system DNA-binding domain-containing protein [Patescibacteria group bacterium]MBU1721623.1 type IV secretion system DNA-binding domain-containing protein [Patescibacteria group bacterium]MBU1901715.1 type IV secretion system DNA-binding domain-containing protein [Patescibacteria group bacterium]
MPAPYLQKASAEIKPKEDICLFAQTNFRNQMRRFGIKVDDRRRHMYVIGKTGMGKSTMMENMMLHDIYNGLGVGLVDPHGDFAEKIIDFIPSWRMNDVVYFNPADLDHPMGFNILEVNNEEQKHLVAAGLMGTFKKIWPDVWSSRMEYILNNTLLALLEYPDSTLLGINRLLSDKKFRNKVVAKVKDPVIKGFWQNEFAGYNDRYAQEAVAPIQNKIGQFLSASVIRNMVAQVKSTINIRQLMDEGKILIMNLSKGRLGEDNSRLLGGMLITKIQLAAMERVDIPEHERKDFFLYVDEFQNFATPSFANILSEARKYRLGLVMAHQYVAQLDEVVADAVFGNVGTIVTFRVGAADAEMLAKEFTPVFLEEDIVNLSKYCIFLKLMIDGVASQPFSAFTMPPIGSPTGSTEKVIRISRERYAKDRASIESKIMRWSGLEPDLDEDDDIDTSDLPPLKHEKKTYPPKERGERSPVKKEQKMVAKPTKKVESSNRPVPTYKKNIESKEKEFVSSAPVHKKGTPAVEKIENVDNTKIIKNDDLSQRDKKEYSAIRELKKPSIDQEEKMSKKMPKVGTEESIATISLGSLPDRQVPKKPSRETDQQKIISKKENNISPQKDNKQVIEPNTVIHFDS